MFLLIQVHSNEGPHPFPRGDSSRKKKYIFNFKKIFFSETISPISTKLGTINPLVKGFKVYANEEPLFPKEKDDGCVLLFFYNLDTGISIAFHN